MSSNATLPAKLYVCRKLADVGTAQSVPALTLLLTDEQLGHPGRYALERIPDASAVAALRDSLSKTQGKLKAGIIDSLGARCDTEAVPVIASTVRDSDLAIAHASILALARIGTPEATLALVEFWPSAPPALRPTAADGLFRVAARQLAQGRSVEAATVYMALESDTVDHVRMGAFLGLVAASPAEAPGRLQRALCSDDPRLRGLAADCIRESSDAELATSMAASLAQLSVTGQKALLEALAYRRDPAVRTAVLTAAQALEPEVRVASLRALGAVGLAEDVPLFVDFLSQGKAEEQAAALESLNQLTDAQANAAISAQISAVAPAIRAALIRVLWSRGAKASVPRLLEAATDSDPQVRRVAFQALAELAEPQDAGTLVQLLAKSAPEERPAAERAVILCSRKIVDPQLQTAAVLAALRDADQAARCALLPALGGLGGEQALELARTASKDTNPDVQLAGIRALANWPDASVAAELLETAKSTSNETHRAWAVRGLALVSPRPGHLPPAQAFDYLKTALSLAKSPEDRQFIVSRMGPVRTPECLAFVISLISDPVVQPAALTAATDLGEALKESHPAESRAALEKVLQVTQDEDLLTRIDRILTRMNWKGN